MKVRTFLLAVFLITVQAMVFPTSGHFDSPGRDDPPGTPLPVLPLADLDGDGRDEVLIPMPGADSGKGSIRVLDGRTGLQLSEVLASFSLLGIGSRVLVTDLDDDGSDELLIMDGRNRSYLLSWERPIPDRTVISQQDLLMERSFDSAVLAEIDDDGKDELIFLDEGRIGVLSDFPETERDPYFPMIGDICTSLQPVDVNGDGRREIAAVMRNETETYIGCLDPASWSVIGTLRRNATMLMAADLDGSGIETLVMREDRTGHGGLVLVPGEAFIDADTSSIRTFSGTSVEPFSEDDPVVAVDLDHDTVQELLLGSPMHEGGKGAVRLVSKDGPPVLTDHAIVLKGDDTNSMAGAHLSGSGDVDGDLGEDAFTIMEGTLRKVPGNLLTRPGTTTSLYLLTGEEWPSSYVEFGGSVRVRLQAEDRSLSTRDLCEVNVTCSGDRTRIRLLETGEATGIFEGEFRVTGHTMSDRSIRGTQGSVVNVSREDVSFSLVVAGTAGIEDPPMLLPGRDVPFAIEDEPFEHDPQIIDPDGDPVRMVLGDAPDWVSLRGKVITGTPKDRDVGNSTVSIICTSGQDNVTIDITIMVENAGPRIIPVSFPRQSWEGLPYEASFLIKGGGDDPGLSLKVVEGPTDGAWLTVSGTGSITGTPDNRDVGTYEFLLEVLDGNDALETYEWAMDVSNTGPSITYPDIGPRPEKVSFEIDLDCDGEGDGLTFYRIISAPSGMVEIDNVTGIMSIVPVYRSDGRFSIEVGVDDGNGGTDIERIEFEVLNRPPVLVGDLPVSVWAWTRTEIPLTTDEDGDDTVTAEFGGDAPFLSMIEDGDGRRIVVYPWNEDQGEWSLEIVLTDRWGSSSRWDWSLSVLENGSSEDPQARLISASWVAEKEIEMELSVSGTGVSILSARLVSGENEAPLDLSLLTSGRSRVHFGSNSATRSNLTLVVMVEMEGGIARVLESTVTVYPYEGKEGGGFPLPLVVLVLAALALLVFLSSAVLVERISYPIQMLIFKGGQPSDGPMLAIVQGEPGMTYSRLLETTSLSRPDAVSTITVLENRGDIYERPDGTHVRFYPMMGSFKDRPLTLNRSQRMISECLLGSFRGLDEEDISRMTGLPAARIRKECQLMELKGAITIKRRQKLDVYKLTREQRDRIRSIG